jgi:hypothetical protein
MTPGRNDPCLCGSGKKYKHCCLRLQEAIPPEDATWRRVLRAIDDLGSRILDASMQHFGRSGIDEAWAEFTLREGEGGFDPKTPEIQLFAPWFLYDWRPDPATTAVPERSHGVTAAQAYVRKMGRRLDSLAARYIEACGQAPFSFHEVVACEPGRSFRLRDALLGTEVLVFEASGSAHARAGDLLFGKVVPIDGIAVVDGCGAAVIPPIEKPRIIELRKRLREAQPLFGGEWLREVHLDLLERYHEIADRLLNPRLPVMQNTDGEPLEMQQLVYDIDAPDEAFAALKDLAVGESEAELLAGAELDAAGKLLRAEIPWRTSGNAMHASWTNTVLGTLRIDGRQLRAEVNSAARAAKLRALIEERLGSRARFRVAKVESAHALFERARAPMGEAEVVNREAERARLAELPEVKGALAELLRTHYRNWLDQKIPALGDRTPRQATADADGREALEALLLQIERDGERMRPALDPVQVVRELRETLGLPGRS